MNAAPQPMMHRCLATAALLVASLAPAWADSGDTDPVRELISQAGLRESAVASRDMAGWSKPRKVVVRSVSPAQVAAFREVAPGVEIIAVRDETEALAAMPGAQALIGLCNEELVDAGTELRWIQIYSAGAGPCTSIAGVRERNLLVTNMQRISSPEIAEHALAMLLAFTRGLHLYLPDQKKGQWESGRLRHANAWELTGRTMLVVGLGGIGTEVAKRANALGMQVLATRASDADKPSFVAYVGKPDELLALAAKADVVVSAVPLLPATEGIFDKKFFDTMKPGGYFINVSRGKNVVQDELLAALKDGRLAGAGLDVTDPEPLPPDHPLWQLPNVIITPHVAATSDGLFGRLGLLTRENLRRYVAGEPLLSLVDNERGY